MSRIFVYSGGSNQSPYDTWAKASTVINNALNLWSPGDEVIVASDHQENPGSSYVAPSVGSKEEPIPVRTSERSGVADVSYEPATIPTIVADLNAFVDIILPIHWTVSGLWFSCSAEIDADSAVVQHYRDCRFTVGIGPSPGSNPDFRFGDVFGRVLVRLQNCTFENSLGVNNRLIIGGLTEFDGCVFQNLDPISSGFILLGGGFRPAYHRFRGCNFDLPAGSVLTNFGSQIEAGCPVEFVNCALPANATIVGSGIDGDQQKVELFGSDDAGALYRYELHHYRGTIITQTGDLYRSGGYVDRNGNVAASHKMTPSANLHNGMQLPGPLLAKHLVNPGTKTVTIHAADSFSTPPNKNQLYYELFYLSDAGEVLASLGTSRDADVFSGAALATTSGEWVDGGGALTHEYKMTADFSIARGGYVAARVVLEGDQTAETANAVYYDPKLEIT